MNFKGFLNAVLQALGFAKEKGWIDKQTGIDPKGKAKDKLK